MAHSNKPGVQFAAVTTFKRRMMRLLLLALAIAGFQPISAVAAQAAHLDTTLRITDAYHLLTRSGFGASPAELLRYTGVSRRWAVDNIVNHLHSTANSKMPAWVNAPAPHYWARGRMPVKKKREFNRERDHELIGLRQWWLQQMIETPSPQSEKLTLFWHNHFTSSYSSINHQSTSIARQHQILRQLSTGNFRNLLTAMLQDPAMLDYLDNINNHKRAPNENLARELLELFTLGEGHFNEQDVRGAARALTGYSIAQTHNMTPRFKPWQHDNGEKILFGQRGNFAVTDLVTFILERPQAATFIAAKFYRAYINEHSGNESDINQLASLFRQSGYDIKTLYRAVFESEAFWALENRNAIVKSPVDLIIGTIRSTGIVPPNWQTLPSTLGTMGQNLFDPPNVAGWPGMDNWVTPARLLTRSNWLHQFASRCNQASTQPCANNQGSMQMPNSGSMMMPPTQGNATDEHLTIQLAAENYDGAPGYQVSLLRNKQDVWQSPEQRVAGGHDTKRLGRLEIGTDMPWQQVRLPVGKEIPEFDQIRVSYLNDNGGSDGDRNLFINWVSVDGKTYPSSKGVQLSSCPPKQMDQAGALYCAGDLLLSKIDLPSAVSSAPDMTMSGSANTGSSKTESVAVAQDTIIYEALYLNWLNDPQKAKHPRIVFTLTGVKFNEQQWHNLSARYQIEPDGSYSMSIENYECWPDCFRQWPACARSADNQPKLRALDFPLQTTHANCHYQLLDREDQLLVDTLWMELPGFYETVAQNAAFMKKKHNTLFSEWQSHIDSMQQRLNTSDYSQSATRRAINVPASTERAITTSINAPLPGGHSNAAYQAQLAQLQTLQPQRTLQVLLRGKDDGSTGNNLTDILRKLDYQLH